MRKVRFYFDPISPYVYLAWTQLASLFKSTEVEWEPIPVLFAALLNAHGQKGPAEIPPKRVYTFKDVFRWAEQYGVPLEGPPAHPFNPLAALRICTAVHNSSDRLRLAGGLLEACWGKGEDLTDPGVLRRLASEAGLDGTRLLELSQSQEIKDRLKSDTQAAIDQGVFGVPSFAVDGEIFWGNDRLPFLKAYLEGKLRIQEEKAQQFLARPRAADRKIPS